MAAPTTPTETEIAQQAADIVLYGDGFSLEQLSRRQQCPRFWLASVFTGQAGRYLAHHVGDALVIPLRLLIAHFIEALACARSDADHWQTGIAARR